MREPSSISPAPTKRSEDIGLHMARSTRDLAGAAFIMMMAFVLSRLTGLVRDMVIGHQFGTSGEYAAYLAAMRIPDFVFQVIAGGAVSSAFIPVFTAYLTRRDAEACWRMVSSLFNLALLVLTPIIIVLMIAAPQIIALIAPGFDVHLHDLATGMTRILLVMPILFSLGGFATSILNSYQRFLLAALAPTTYNLGIILGASLLAQPLGIYGLATGAALGSCLYLLIQIPGLIQVGLVYRPILDIDHPGVREVTRLMLPRMLGLAVGQVNFVVNLILASGMAERYAALNYAWLLTMLPLGIFAMAISTAVFPTLADQTAREQMGEMKRTLSTSLRLILYLTLPASIGLIVLRVPIIRLLFERGEFTSVSTEATAFALQFYAVGLSAQAAVEIVTRAFYVLHDTRTPVLIGTGAMLINAVLSIILVHYLAQGGLALAASLASIGEVIVLFTMAQRRLQGIDEQRIFHSLLKTLTSALLMGGAVWSLTTYLSAYLNSSLLLDQVVLVGMVITFGAIVHFSVSWLLGSEEPRQLYHLLFVRLTAKDKT
ncbi:MAG: murein biosynthesis integral membrane protein MurJ [Chloroflexi bacterium]|nr:murein biosynthesis integral membrane protein MurJ [Chloroflexota bacterium]MCL5074250.1 murein biosynthesis integral membrane protein MurJ [Chloroflexota bacterium]